MIKRIFPALFAIFCLFTLSCQGEKENSLEKITLNMKGHKITVELARTPQERQNGLMNRKEMDENMGMLFVFDKEERRSFWMKNTYIPLSIAYIDGKGVIIDIQDMSPLDTTPHPSTGPAQYALEVNRGMFDKWDITEGYQINLENL